MARPGRDGATPGAPQAAAGPVPRLPGGSMASAAVRGSAWTLGGYAAGQLLRLAGNLVLTRLLFPEVFGQMALVNTFMQGLQMFSDVGIGPAIVQGSRGDDPRFLRTAWTVQAVRGAILWLGSCAIAGPIASFYAQPLLAWLIPAAGLSAVLAGFESTSLHALRRHLRLDRVTVVELAGQGIGIAATVLLAAADRRVHGANHPGAAWAMVGGGLVGSASRLLLSHALLPGIRHRLDLDRGDLRALLRFGRWIFVSTLLTFLASQSDRLVFGKMIPLDLFGVYGIAAMLAAMPTQAVLRLGNSVAFPAYSRLAGRDDFRDVFGRVRLPLVLGGGAVVSALLACGPFLIRVLYDTRYLQAGWILQYLSAITWLQILECTNGAALLARGRVGWVAAGNAAKLAGMLAFIPLGFHVGGFRGALVGLIASEAARYLTSVMGTAALGLGGFGRDVLLTAFTAAVAWAGSAGGQALAGADRGALAGLAVAAAVTGAPWALIGGRYLRRARARAGSRPEAPGSQARPAAAGGVGSIPLPGAPWSDGAAGPGPRP